MSEEKIFKGDEYCGKFTPYKKRNAYNFIRCFEEYGDELEKKAETERLAAVEAAKRDNLTKIKQLEPEKAALQANTKKAPPSAQKERVKFYLEECLRSFNAAVEAFNALSDEEREKPKAAIKTIAEKMVEVMKQLGEKGDQS